MIYPTWSASSHESNWCHRPNERVLPNPSLFLIWNPALCPFRNGIPPNAEGHARHRHKVSPREPRGTSKGHSTIFLYQYESKIFLCIRRQTTCCCRTITQIKCISITTSKFLQLSIYSRIRSFDAIDGWWRCSRRPRNSWIIFWPYRFIPLEIAFHPQSILPYVRGQKDLSQGIHWFQNPSSYLNSLPPCLHGCYTHPSWILGFLMTLIYSSHKYNDKSQKSN